MVLFRTESTDHVLFGQSERGCQPSIPSFVKCAKLGAAA
jgi:hypothetical protein